MYIIGCTGDITPFGFVFKTPVGFAATLFSKEGFNFTVYPNALFYKEGAPQGRVFFHYTTCTEKYLS